MAEVCAGQGEAQLEDPVPGGHCCSLIAGGCDSNDVTCGQL